MALIGTFTNVGLDKARDVTTNPGFKIRASSFKVSNQKTLGGIPALQALTGPNAGLFYSGLISSAVNVGDQTVQITGTIPPGQSAGQEAVNEIYIFALDVNNVEFLLAVGQPQSGSNVLYDPSGETTLRLQLRLTNADISSIVTFEFTQATEISEHNQDPNAHPDIRDMLHKAGLFESPSLHEFIGQNFDEFPSFDPSVVDDDVVYRDTDGLYKRAVADGTNKSKVMGIAKLDQGIVPVSGLVRKAHGYPALTRLYLHPSNPGQVTDLQTDIPLGLALSTTVIALRVDEPNFVRSHVDAVVSDLPGYKHFSNAQDAIDSVPDGGWVRFDVDYPLRGPDPLKNNGKVVNFLFTGTASGVHAFGGVNEVQLLSFSAPPDGGDYVLVHDGNKTSRLAFNANAATIQSALNALPSLSAVVVSGNYTSGFTITFAGADGLQDQPLVVGGTYAGNDEVQLLDFDSTDFDSGSFRLNFNGQLTSAIAFNSINAASIKAALDALSNVDFVTVAAVGSPSIPGHTQFTVQFGGTTGLQDQPLITVPSGDNSLADSLAQPITGSVTQQTQGVQPDNLLTASSAPVSISSAVATPGEEPGSDVGFFLDTAGCQIIGLGRLKDFSTAIDLNLSEDTRIEMLFDSCVLPIDDSGLTTAQYNTDGSLGLASSLDQQTAERNLAKVYAQPIPDKTTYITAAYASLGDGSEVGILAGRRVSDFSGATINWLTGAVVGGDSFTPYTPVSSTAFFKYGVILKTDGSLGILLPSGEGSLSSNAPYPRVANGILRAIVTLQGDGLGGILDVTSSMIKRFTNTGAVNFDVAEVEIESQSGGQSVFDFSSLTTLRFDPDNTVFDLEVFVSNMPQEQDQTGGLLEDYRKISDSEIEFSYSVPAGTPVRVRIKTSDIAAATNGVQTEAKVYKATANGTDSEYDFTGSGAAWSPINTIYDIEVLINGQEQLQDETGLHAEDFIKTASGKVQFSKDGAPYTPPAGAKIWVRSRLFQMGGATPDTDLQLASEGVDLATKTERLDIVGLPVVVSQTSPGQHQLEVLPSEGANVGTGADVFRDRSGLDLNFRRLRGGPGVFVYQDGDDIVISLADSSYFREFRTNLSGSQVTSAGLYDLMSGKLAPFRNGLRLINSLSLGDPIDRYQEDASRVKINLAQAAITSDVFGYVHQATAPSWYALYDGASMVGLTDLATPQPYLLGSDRVRVYRNGLILNTSGYGAATDRYSELDVNTVRLDSPALSTDWFLVEYDGVAPLFQEDVSGFVGATMNLANQYTVGSNKLFVYKNGLLMNDVGLGAAGGRYSEVGSPMSPSQQVSLPVNANLSDWFYVLCRS